MMEILSLGTGWTECDICGSGEGVITVHVADLEETYDFYASHGCHGRESRAGISRDELLERIKGWDHIVRTRRARAAIRDFCRRVRRGEFCPEQQALNAPQSAATFSYYYPLAEEEATSPATTWGYEPECTCSFCQRRATAPVDPPQTITFTVTELAEPIVVEPRMWLNTRPVANQEDEPF